MTARDPDSPVRRMAVAIGAAAAIMVAAGVVYLLMASKETISKFNGAAIVAAARDYTRDLKARKQPIPDSVTLDDLVALHFLKEDQAEAFHGLKAAVVLQTKETGPQAVVMRVRWPDGGEIVLRADGTVEEVAH